MDGLAGVKNMAGQEPNNLSFTWETGGASPAATQNAPHFRPSRIDVLTRAVNLVAGMNLAEAERAAGLARVIADVPSTTPRIPE